MLLQQHFNSTVLQEKQGKKKAFNDPLCRKPIKHNQFHNVISAAFSQLSTRSGETVQANRAWDGRDRETCRINAGGILEAVGWTETHCLESHFRVATVLSTKRRWAVWSLPVHGHSARRSASGHEEQKDDWVALPGTVLLGNNWSAPKRLDFSFKPFIFPHLLKLKWASELLLHFSAWKAYTAKLKSSGIWDARIPKDFRSLNRNFPKKSSPFALSTKSLHQDGR